MTKNLLDLSGKIDGFKVVLFETVAKVTESLSMPFFVVGATARDIILYEGYNIQMGRATEDIDLAVQVLNWSSYEQLKAGLVTTGKFGLDKKQAQRLLYEEWFPIDVIPFGAIAGTDDCLSWPPAHDTIMSTLGFEEAYNNSITVRMRTNPVLDIKFVSLSGLALLKIISWNDNKLRSHKDAHDLLLLMRTYLDAGNEERLLNEEIDLIGKDFDYIRASSRLLGRDIATILNPVIKETIVKILDKETEEQNHYRLVEDMMDRGAESNDFEEALQLLEDLKAGMLDKYKP